MQRRPSLVPDLFHIKRTTVTKSPPSMRTEVCGTYTDLDSAQAAGLHRLEDEGYPAASMSEYAVNETMGEPPSSSSSWHFGQNVLVHAQKDDEIHKIEIESTPNSLGVRARPGAGRVQDQLFYVVLTVQSEDGSASNEIRGIHLSRQAAVTAARHELVSGGRTEDWYREFKDDTSAVSYLEDAGGTQVVHLAVGRDGERYVVSVTHES